jgi:hypothetical protein
MYRNEVFTNLTYLNEEKNLLFKNSFNVWLVSRKINLIAIFIIILLNLMGNLITIFYKYSNKKFLHKPCHIFLLVLTINNSLFLIVYFFEDTLHTYSELYMNGDGYLFILFNIKDQFEISCKSCMYIYFLDFIFNFYKL